MISLFNWPAQIIQSSAGGFPSNHIECLTSHHQLTMTCNQLCLANPTDKYACQWSSSPPARSFTGSHICQLDLLGTVDYTVFVSWWCDVCSIQPDIFSWYCSFCYQLNLFIFLGSYQSFLPDVHSFQSSKTVASWSLQDFVLLSSEVVFPLKGGKKKTRPHKTLTNANS